MRLPVGCRHDRIQIVDDPVRLDVVITCLICHATDRVSVLEIVETDRLPRPLTLDGPAVYAFCRRRLLKGPTAC